MKPLNSGHLRAFKNLPVTERCPLMEGKLTKIVIFRLNNLSAIQSMSAMGRFHCRYNLNVLHKVILVRQMKSKHIIKMNAWCFFFHCGFDLKATFNVCPMLKTDEGIKFLHCKYFMWKFLFSRLELPSYFTCGIAAIMKWGKTCDIYLVVFSKQNI